MDSFIKKMSEIPAVSGNETLLRKYIISLIDSKCESINIDSMGNVIAFKKGTSSEYKVMLGSHMDESGFIVSKITDTGFLKIKPVGKIEPRSVLSKRVIVGDGSTKGIIGMKAIHLQKKEERESAVNIEDLYIDIGAENKEDAMQVVSLGDYVTFDTQYDVLGDKIKGKALKRLGCMCLIEAMKEKPVYDTWFVFSTQREIPSSVPGRGMKIAANRIQPDYALIVDSIPADDIYKNEENKIALGSGVIIVHSDRTTIADINFLSSIKKIAKKNNIHFSETVAPAEASIGGAVQSVAVDAKIAVVSIAGRYLNTPVSVMDKNDIDAVSNLCSAFLKESDVIIDGTFRKAHKN